MPRPGRGAAAVLGIAAAVGIGYALAIFVNRPGEAPSHAQPGSAPPAGIEAAVRAALSTPDPLERAAALAQLLRLLGPEALGHVRPAFDDAYLDSGDLELVLLADWWARFDPEAAFEWANDSRIGWHPSVLAAVVRNWATRDPHAASRAIARRVSDFRLRSACFVALAHGWDDSGKEGLLDYLRQLPHDEVFALTVDSIARRRLLRDGTEATIAWAEALPDGDAEESAPLKLEVYRRLGGTMARVDPERAASWAVQQAGGRYSAGLTRRVATAWAEHDGRAAMTWLGSQPDDDELNLTVQETYRTWLMRDRKDATDWMRAAELEPWLDPAVGLFARSFLPGDPLEALAWANRMHRPAFRDQTLFRIVRVWLGREPDAAAAWLEHAELSDELRKRIDDLRAGAKAPAARAGGQPSAAEGAAHTPPAPVPAAP